MKELKDEISRLHAENAALQQGYDAARLEIESLRDEVKEYRHGAGVQKALIETLLDDKPAGEYPPLPEPYHVAYDDIDKEDVKCFAEGQLRAYVDTDRAMRAQAAPVAQGDALDAARYRMLRRGQHWSVINGVGDTLRAEELDAAIDAARSKAKEGGAHA